MKPIRTLVGLAAAATAATMALAPSATAASHEDLTTGLVGPLGLDVSKDGVFVAQSFAGSVDKVLPDGTLVNLANTDDPVGIAVDGGRTVFTSTTYSDGGEGPVSSAQLKLRRANGTVTTLARLLAFEKNRNPDRRMTYGVLGTGKNCRAKLPAPPEGKPYKGLLDSHPYAIAEAPQGGWYVADAAGNDILHVSPRGKVKVVKVLRPVVSRVTQQVADKLDLPQCAVGKKLAVEAVPTDVEVTKRGNLIVSLLPGGPETEEGPVLGPRGRVVQIFKSGKVRTIADGLMSATNVAIGDANTLYVTELFAGRIAKVNRNTGKVSTFYELNLPSAVEVYKGKVYATYNTFPDGPPDGRIAVIDPDGKVIEKTD